MSQEAMLRARDLIKQRRFAEARAILKQVNTPTSAQWLAKLDELDPPPPPPPSIDFDIPSAFTPQADEDDFFFPSKAAPAQASQGVKVGGPVGRSPVYKPIAKTSTSTSDRLRGVQAVPAKPKSKTIPLPIALGIIFTLLSVGGCVLAGAYAVMNTDFSSFNFTQSVRSAGVGAPTLGVIGYGQNITGLLTDEQPRQAWTFTGRAGERVVIQLASEDFDTLLELYSPSLELIEENDDFGGGNRNSQIDLTLPADGTYTIVATEWGAGVFVVGGAYGLTLLRQ